MERNEYYPFKAGKTRDTKEIAFGKPKRKLGGWKSHVSLKEPEKEIIDESVFDSLMSAIT